VKVRAIINSGCPGDGKTMEQKVLNRWIGAASSQSQDKGGLQNPKCTASKSEIKAGGKQERNRFISHFEVVGGFFR
jgi:hypothetical protein